MRIVVDTNIVFSAILNADSKLGKILLFSKKGINFYSTRQLLSEIEEHKQKIKKISNYSEEELHRVIQLLTQKIRFIDVKLISKDAFQYAENLTADVDIDDTEFIALTEHLKGQFWSGDKILIQGLLKKKWNKFITTNQLFEKISSK